MLSPSRYPRLFKNAASHRVFPRPAPDQCSDSPALLLLRESPLRESSDRSAQSAFRSGAHPETAASSPAPRDLARRPLPSPLASLRISPVLHSAPRQPKAAASRRLPLQRRLHEAIRVVS